MKRELTRFYVVRIFRITSEKENVLPDRTDISKKDIETVRDLLHRAWFAIQEHHLQLGGAALSLPLSDLKILTLLAGRTDVILRDIRDVLGIPHSTLTGVIDRLERHGLVRRVMTQRDRRSYGLELTDEGKAFQRRHDRADDELARRVLSVLRNEGERQQFIELLERIATELS